MKTFVRVVIYYFAIITVISCKSDADNKLVLIDNEINEQWVNKNILFPSSLKPLNLLPQKEKDSSKFNVVVYYDGNCSSCYVELNKWKVLIKEFNDSKVDVSFTFILTGMNSNLVRSYLKEIEFEHENVFFDAKEEFKKVYGFMLENNYRYSSLLVNEQNKVVFVGNLMLFKGFKDRCLEEIQKNS